MPFSFALKASLSSTKGVVPLKPSRAPLGPGLPAEVAVPPPAAVVAELAAVVADEAAVVADAAVSDDDLLLSLPHAAATSDNPAMTAPTRATRVLCIGVAFSPLNVDADRPMCQGSTG